MSATEHQWRGTPVEITTHWGAKLTVLLEDASHYGDVLESGVSWAYETAYLEPFAEPGDTVVDVGANYGYTASYFASECGPDGFVLSVEPEPDTRALLEHNMRVNDHHNVKVVPCAAGAERGWTELWRSETNLANHSVNQALVPNVRDSVRVEVRTVDDLVAEFIPDRPPTLLKIDVEGWEWEVMQGSLGVLENARPAVWLEYWPDGIRANGNDPRGVLDILYDRGYAISVHELVEERVLALTGDEIISYCDDATQRFKEQGLFHLHGIVYLHATQPGQEVRRAQ
jgi:FkbM family methyltransferase